MFADQSPPTIYTNRRNALVPTSRPVQIFLGVRKTPIPAGDWDVVKTFFPMNGKPIVPRGTCKQYMIQDGKFLQSDFTLFNPDGTNSTRTGISGFDSKTNRFTTVWYDSRQTTMSIRQSDGTFDGKNIVLWATPLDPDKPGRKTVARAHLEEDGRLLLHRHFLIDDKGQERMIIELRMTRK
jgi:hypothetical protein